MKMKSTKMALFVVMALALLASGVAYAEAVQGTVASVDLAGNTLTVTKTDVAGATEEVSITVNDTTTYSGEVTSLAEVIEGDDVTLEAEKDAVTGNWVAKSVDVPTPAE
ncbi:MAG: hypothetical protein HY447_04700 [Candidatus Omnitrophica bacterium]|nr:hypothetical protein [Candidatus Omnitrophota bacterium]